MKGSKRIVPLLDLRASLLTMLAPRQEVVVVDVGGDDGQQAG
jgi:hypothetical protein